MTKLKKTTFGVQDYFFIGRINVTINCNIQDIFDGIDVVANFYVKGN